MSYLLVGGCSWSHLKFKSGISPEVDTSFPKWSEHLAKYLDVPLVSVAESGRGQYWNYKRFMEHILSDSPPKYLCWQLSESLRRELTVGPGNIKPPFLRYGFNLDEHYTTLEQFIEDLKSLRHKKMDHETQQKILNIYREFYALDFNYLIALDENFKMIYQIKKICEIMNIKFYIFCSDVAFISAFKHINSEVYNLLIDFILAAKGRDLYLSDPKQTYDSYFSNQYDIILNMINLESFKKLENDHKGIYGWPFIKELGGDSIEAVHNRDHNVKGKYIYNNTVSRFDVHPNANGHLKLFEDLLPLLKEEWNI